MDTTVHARLAARRADEDAKFMKKKKKEMRVAMDM